MNPEFQKFAPPDGQQFVSMGFLCSLLQLVPAQICAVMEASDVRFSMLMDCVGYFSVKDAELLSERCNSLRKEIADAAAKFEAATSN